MSFPAFLQGFGSIGVFASRAFLPAFVTALLLRFGPQVPWLADQGLIPHVRDVPTWFTSNVSLAVLGLMAALELLAERFSEAKVVFEGVHDYVKTAMAVLTYIATVNATDHATVRQAFQEAGTFDYLPALAVGGGVYLATQARRAVVGPLTESDEDDDLGLQGVIRWAEDVWAGLGTAALILFPLLALVALGLALVALVVIERRVVAGREKAKVPCPTCGRPMHASAPVCPSCRSANPGPRDVNLLGAPKTRPADPAALPFELVAVKRCPVCAARLDRKAVRQSCAACGHPLMGDRGFARDYVSFVDRRVPKVAAVCFVLGLVPILGVIPGVIYYRLAIVAPFRRYIPPGRGLLLRWGVRLAVVLLVALQWIPVAGGLALLAMALINYAAYRSAYRSLALAAD